MAFFDLFKRKRATPAPAPTPATPAVPRPAAEPAAPEHDATAESQLNPAALDHDGPERRERNRRNARAGTRVLVIDDSPTIVALRLWSDAVDATTAASAFPVATAIDAFVESEPAGLVQLSVSGADCNLQWDADDSPTALAAYRDLIALLPNGVAPAHCRASSQRPLTEASFFITVPRDTAPDVVQAMRERAADLGVPAEITVAA